ncbi:hypothetical protein ABEB36_012022 [Hypothenemus hampei]|uniref:Poor Imd response upon knock-in n=1 Tax=Hypothenemus hampei TaxID=57062 RepID=A0ABD1E9T1_HYPHA
MVPIIVNKPGAPSSLVNLKQVTTFTGNNLRMTIRENNCTLLLTGNNCLLTVVKNYGLVKVVGNNCKVFVKEPSLGTVEYLGNNGVVEMAGINADYQNVTYLGCNGTVTIGTKEEGRNKKSKLGGSSSPKPNSVFTVKNHKIKCYKTKDIVDISTLLPFTFYN